MENSKRIQRALKKLRNLSDCLSYYTNDCKEFQKDFKELEELIHELGLDKKEDHTRLAKKLKAIWESTKEDK